MAPSTAELYTPRRDINGQKCAHSGLRKNMVNFEGKSGKTAEYPGIATARMLLPTVISTAFDPVHHARPTSLTLQASDAARQVVPVQQCVGSSPPNSSSVLSAANA